MAKKTTTRKAATPKPKTSRATLPKTTSTQTKKTPTKIVATAPLPKVVTVSGPMVSEPDLKKRELIDLAVARSGMKKRDIKPAVEAILAVLGETIASGRELNLQPLGKLRINRTEEKSNGRVIICKLRQSLAKKPEPTNILTQVAE